MKRNNNVGDLVICILASEEGLNGGKRGFNQQKLGYKTSQGVDSGLLLASLLLLLFIDIIISFYKHITNTTPIYGHLGKSHMVNLHMCRGQNVVCGVWSHPVMGILSASE